MFCHSRPDSLMILKCQLAAFLRPVSFDIAKEDVTRELNVQIERPLAIELT